MPPLMAYGLKVTAILLKRAGAAARAEALQALLEVLVSLPPASLSASDDALNDLAALLASPTEPVRSGSKRSREDEVDWAW